MDKYEAKAALYDAFRNRLTQDKSKKGYICPICGSGSGKSGTGITENKNSKGHYTCWAGCFTNADAIEIVAQQEGLDANSTEAIKRAYELYNIDLDVPAPQINLQDIAPMAELWQEPVDYTSYYKKCRARLTEPQAQAYLSYRGISTEVADKHWLGYDANWQSPTALRTGKNPPKSARLIIPTSTTSYVAREANKDATGAYIKMKEGKANIFNSKALYNEDKRPVFIVEGELDALSVIEAGGEACGLGSTTYIRKLLDMLKAKPTTCTLIICLDNDEAGTKATTELIEGLQALNISCIKADICGKAKDANEALTSDKDTFLQAIADAEAITASKPDNVANYIDRLIVGEIERFKEGANRVTGFKELDRVAGGVYAGLYALGAISSLGKTTFISQIADQMAQAGNNVLYFSLEQSRLEMVSKAIARKSAQIDIKTATTSLKIRQGQLTEAVLKAADAYKNAVGNRLSIIEGNFNCTLAYICEYVTGYIKRNKVKPVVIIDYLQILQTDDTKRSTKELIDNNVTELKRLSRREDIPIFLISSVNRSNYLAPIDFESFKESGGIEYTADVVWGLQLQAINDDIFSKEGKLKDKRFKIREAKAENPRKLELICLKNRYGISSYSVAFDYYPQFDLFKEDSGFKSVSENYNPFSGNVFTNVNDYDIM